MEGTCASASSSIELLAFEREAAGGIGDFGCGGEDCDGGDWCGFSASDCGDMEACGPGEVFGADEVGTATGTTPFAAICLLVFRPMSAQILGNLPNPSFSLQSMKFIVDVVNTVYVCVIILNFDA